MKSVILIPVIFLFVSCATRPTTEPAVNTSALSGHLDRIDATLSRSDAKAVVIRRWLETH